MAKRLTAESLLVALKPLHDQMVARGLPTPLSNFLKGLIESGGGGTDGGGTGGGGTGGTTGGGTGTGTEVISGGGSGGGGERAPEVLALGTIRTLTDGNDIWPAGFGDSNANDDVVRGIGGNDTLTGGNGNDYLAGDSDVATYTALPERKIVDTAQDEASFDVAERRDGSGGFIVVWKTGDGPNESHIRMELLDQNGNSTNPQVLVDVADNGLDATAVHNPVVEAVKAGANAGKIWVGYTDGFSPAGGAVAHFKIFNTDGSGAPGAITVPSLNAGQQVIRFWLEGTSNGDMLLAQATTGAAPPQLVKYTSSGAQIAGTIALSAAPGGSGGSNKIAMTQMNAGEPGDVGQPNVAMVYGDNLRIIDPGNAGSPPTAVAGPFLLPGEAFGIGTLPLASGGGFVVGYDGGVDSIMLQRYSAAGVAVGLPVQINSTGQADEVSTANDADLAVSVDGVIIVTWADNGIIYERAYDASLTPLFDPTLVNVNTLLDADTPNVAVSQTLDGVFAGLVAWEADAGVGQTERDIYAAALSPVQGSGNDTLYGGEGFDTLLGGEGNDLIEGGTLSDTLRGGVGSDTVDYRNSGASVTIDLATGANTATGSDVLSHARGDNISGFENVIGSRFLDTLTGSAGVNSIYGGSSTDSIAGLDGGDLLDGGSGVDQVSYRASNDRVFADLNFGTAAFGHASGDSVINFENALGSNFDDTFNGTVGANIFQGFSGNDSFFAGPGGDTLFGGDNNDDIRGGGGADTLDGGTGIDVADYANAGAAVTVDLSDGAVEVGSDAAGDVLTGIESVRGSAFNDLLTGQNLGGTAGALMGLSGNDTLEGRAGADTLDGGAEEDTASYRLSTVAVVANLATGAVGGDAAGDSFVSIENLWGGQAGDTLTGNSGVNSLQGDSGADTLQGGSGADQLFGDSGADLLLGGSGADLMNGGDGFDIADYLAATSGVTVGLNDGVAEGGDTLAAGDSVTFVEGVVGSNFADTLIGDGAANYLLGNDGNDTLLSGAGADTINGGLGDDYLHDGLGAFADQFRGGGGNDVASYTGAAAAFYANLETGLGFNGAAVGDTYLGVENLIGGGSGDSLIGDAGTNYLRGQTGADSLYGGLGSDSLFGEDGDDKLQFDSADSAVIGGAGIDTLLGTAGADLVQMNAARFTFAGQHAAIEAFDLGDGNDYYQGSTTAAHFSLLATSGVTVFGGSGNDYLNMRGNGAVGGINDYVDGGAGNDQFWGGAGNDTFVGGDGGDNTYGGFGNDTLFGGSGFDIHYVGRNEGNDTIFGGADSDGLVLFWGNDALLNGPTYDGVDPSEIAIVYGASTVTINYDTGGSVTFNKGDINTINLFDYGNGDAGNSGAPPATYLRNIWSASWDNGSQSFTAFTLAVDG